MVTKAREILGPRVDIPRCRSRRARDRGDRSTSSSPPRSSTGSTTTTPLRPAASRARAGGRLVAQCGGRGNVATLAEAIVQAASDPRVRAALRRGATDVELRRPRGDGPAPRGAASPRSRCWLEPKQVTPADPLAFLMTVSLGPHLAGCRRSCATAVRRSPGALRASACPRLRPAQYRGRASQTRVAAVTDAPRIVLLPGDGIGPEIVAAARQLLETLGEFDFDERLLGGCSIDADGVALTDEVLEACRGARTRSCSARSAARNGTRPTPTRRGPSRACSGSARGWACTPTCVRSGRARPWSARARCARTGSPAPTCSSSAS